MVCLTAHSSLRRILPQEDRQPHVNVLGDCTILEADNGSTALDIMSCKLAAGRNIDIVLMDYVIMVHMNGPEAVQRMRIESGYRGLVVGITGNALTHQRTWTTLAAREPTVLSRSR